VVLKTRLKISIPGRENLERFGHEFETRQVGRNPLVGFTEANMPMLMGLANRVLDALEPSLPEQPFVFGTRPSNADFALFGQLSQFTVDLAAIGPCQDRAPYTMRWCHHVHDLSGHVGPVAPRRHADEPRGGCAGRARRRGSEKARWGEIAATDFLSVEVLTRSGLIL
jgi:hypothetical protein